MVNKKIILTEHAIKRIRKRWTKNLVHAKELMVRADRIPSPEPGISYFMHGNRTIIAKELKSAYIVITVVNNKKYIYG